MAAKIVRIDGPLGKLCASVQAQHYIFETTLSFCNFILFPFLDQLHDIANSRKHLRSERPSHDRFGRGDWRRDAGAVRRVTVARIAGIFPQKIPAIAGPRLARAVCLQLLLLGTQHADWSAGAV